MWISIHLKHRGEVQLLQRVTEKIKESRTKASERQTAALLSKVCVLTLRQCVDSHPKLPEIGMLHCLISWNSLLGFVLRRQKQETIRILWLYQKTHQCSNQGIHKKFVTVPPAVIIKEFITKINLVTSDAKLKLCHYRNTQTYTYQPFFISSRWEEKWQATNWKSDMNWWYCGSRLVP